jgi:hypothetical protein
LRHLGWRPHHRFWCQSHEVHHEGTNRHIMQVLIKGSGIDSRQPKGELASCVSDVD